MIKKQAIEDTLAIIELLTCINDLDIEIAECQAKID